LRGVGRDGKHKMDGVLKFKKKKDVRDAGKTRPLGEVGWGHWEPAEIREYLHVPLNFTRSILFVKNSYSLGRRKRKGEETGGGLVETQTKRAVTQER